jgi:hypothetical protein
MLLAGAEVMKMANSAMGQLFF